MEAQRLFKKLAGGQPSRVDNMFGELEELLENGRRIGTTQVRAKGRATYVADQ